MSLTERVNKHERKTIMPEHPDETVYAPILDSRGVWRYNPLTVRDSSMVTMVPHLESSGGRIERSKEYKIPEPKKAKTAELLEAVPMLHNPQTQMVRSFIET